MEEKENNSTNVKLRIKTSVLTPVRCIAVALKPIGTFSKQVAGYVKRIPLSDRISLFMAFFAFLSVIVSAWSVHQMYQDRKAAYRPEIMVNPIDVDISWSADGNETWRNNEEPRSEPVYESADANHGDYSISVRSVIESIEKLPVVNIGAGTAKDVEFLWDSGNTQRLFDSLIACDPSRSEFCTIGEKWTVFSYADAHKLQVGNEKSSTYMYLLPISTDEGEKQLAVPIAYSILINELVKNENYYDCFYNNYTPNFFLTITYSDILGNNYTKQIMFTITRVLLSESQDGSGTAHYQIVPHYAVE